MDVSFLSRLLGGDERKEEPSTQGVSGKPIGKFRVDSVLRVFTRPVLIGEVLEGTVYPGCKLKGRGTGKIVRMEQERREVEFAASGDRVALMLENGMSVEEGDVLEIYP
ncbi:tRNA-binding protein Pbp11 [Thermococcus radiotolerans]|uniref:tRNA-binding protein Pbp11 n=1 Tax=Thermococcus radiotolerans TaxID=187880 RepID=UPI001E2EEFA0|nr:tRNA-binding protein Pbp11 [Thermococcus radiotolerans]